MALGLCAKDISYTGRITLIFFNCSALGVNSIYSKSVDANYACCKSCGVQIRKPLQPFVTSRMGFVPMT